MNRSLDDDLPVDHIQARGSGPSGCIGRNLNGAIPLLSGQNRRYPGRLLLDGKFTLKEAREVFACNSQRLPGMERFANLSPCHMVLKSRSRWAASRAVIRTNGHADADFTRATGCQ